MDISEEVRAAHKREFADFLDQDVGKGIYMDEIKAMINHKRLHLIVNISDLHSFRDLGNRSVTRLVPMKVTNLIGYM
ncbi:hypothetical protein K1719_033615 [Acacia pycnantha]|nr:hypothetical protein K1719_033615 [Acacia pycnantha]